MIKETFIVQLKTRWESQYAALCQVH